MRVTIERSQLLKSLGHVQNIVERRTTIPILSNVLVAARDGTVQLTATDLEAEAVDKVPADITTEGATTVPAHLFHDIVRKLPDGSQIELEQGPDEGRLSIASGRSRFSLQALPPDDFPSLAMESADHNFSIHCADLKAMIDKTRFAISTEETRYYLNGIYIHHIDTNDGARLRAVATDGHRLAQVELACPPGAEGLQGVIVPRKTVIELVKLLEDDDTNVEVALSQNIVRFTINNTVLTSKLIDGTFPDYERVIPSGNDKTLEVDRQLFSKAVDRVSTVSAEKGRAIKLNVNADRVVLTVNNPDSGNAEEEVSASYDGEPMDVGFNAQYLLDITGQLDGDTARFFMSDSASPTIVRDAANEAVLYVLMPMRV